MKKTLKKTILSNENVKVLLYIGEGCQVGNDCGYTGDECYVGGDCGVGTNC